MYIRANVENVDLILSTIKIERGRESNKDDFSRLLHKQRLLNIKMYTNGDNKKMDDIEADGLIPHVQSTSFTVNGDEDNDVEFSETDSSAAPGNNVRILYQRLRTQDSIQLDDSPFVSEIFVKHADEDSVKGDPLGGFLCTGSRSDGTFLHAFCSLQPDGILAKDFSVKDKDILVSLNGKKTLGSFEYDHGVVLALFRTLPMTEKISMVIYNRKSETFTTIEFLLEGTKEEVIVKENSVKLMTMQPKVKVLMAQKDSTSLAVRNEELTLRQSASVMSDCTYHFIVRKWLDGGYYLKYSFQVQKNKSKFLGLNGTQLDIVNDTDVASIKTFRKEKIKRDVYLRPCGRDDLYLCFNQTRKLFELKTREHVHALKEEGCGMFMINTFCPP
eukprot:XP_011433375.2 PREDICTED: uncharacterized protein LOC105332460 [Crassostrea gigas]